MTKKGNQPLQATFVTLSSILLKRFLNNHPEMKPPTLESKSVLHVKQVLLFTQKQPSVDEKKMQIGIQILPNQARKFLIRVKW
jgi:hypothetical protein